MNKIVRDLGEGKFRALKKWVHRTRTPSGGHGGYDLAKSLTSFQISVKPEVVLEVLPEVLALRRVSAFLRKSEVL